MKQALKKLSQEQIKFIHKECNITEETLMRMDDDELEEVVYETMCDIEVAELNYDGEPKNDRCKMACGIVTLLGNAIDKDDGFYD